jgi:ankyrin repeat protein
MSDLYAVRVAARPDPHTVELDIQVVHPDAMHIPATPGFALMLLHDRAGADAPLAQEVDLDTVMDASWASANARAFVESVELLSSKNEPPQAALSDYEHAYWNNPKRWLAGRLRIRATDPAWVSHVPGHWDSAAFDPASSYAASPPARPGAEVEFELESAFASSEGFLPAPKLMIASEVSASCPELMWIPRHGARAYEPHERLTGIEITLERFASYLGQPVMWRASEDDPAVGIVTKIEDGRAALVSITSGSRSTRYLAPEDLTWIGRAAFRRGTPRLATPLQLERMLDYASPAAEAVEVAGREATVKIWVFPRERLDGLQLDSSADVLRLLAVPARDDFGDFDNASAKLGQALRREKETREIYWDSELYPKVAEGFIESFELEAPERPRGVDLDELARAQVLELITGRRWPYWTLRVVVSDPAWLEHLEGGGAWSFDPEQLEAPEPWEGPPRLFDPERDLAGDADDEDEGDDAGKSTLRREFDLPAPAVTRDGDLPPHDPRAILHDHGLWEDVSHPAARDNFEEACKLGKLEAVRAYLALGIDPNSHAEISGETPLIRAAEGDQPDVIRVLSVCGADLQGRDSGGDTAIMTAVNWTNPAALRALLEVGADPDAPDHWENYPLVKALEENEEELISILLEGGASLTAGAATQDSALHWCLRNSDGARLRELLGREGAELDLATASGDTLLHLAILAEDEELAEILIDAGADLRRENDWGWAARDIAAAIGADAIAARLELAGAPLTRAARIAYFEDITSGEEQAVVAALRDVEIDARNPHGHTAFMHAVGEGQFDIVELLAARGADINARDKDEDNALAHATDAAMRRRLLELGVEAAYRDSKGVLRQPGVEAVLEGDDHELLRALLDRNTNFSDLSDLSVCHSSFVWGDFEHDLEARAETLRMLGLAGADLEAPDKDNGSSLLVGYINRALEPCVEALLEVGVDIEHANHNHVTALLQSCGEYGDHEIQARITRALLARGADYGKIEWRGESAWDEARSVSNEECVVALEQAFAATLSEALAERGLPEDCPPERFDAELFAALARRTNHESFRHFVRTGEHAIVRGLLAAGFDPNPPVDERGIRPGKLALSEAIGTGDEHMLDILLEGGADPNIAQSYGFTALSNAVSEGQAELVRRLLTAGANPDQVTDSGYSPLHTAAAKGRLDLCQLLVEAGAKVQPYPSGPALLHGAVRNGHFEIAQWLLARGANINARAEGRVTALLLAIRHDEVELALALLAAGADPQVQTDDEERTTALILATKKGDTELIEALLAAGADPRVQDAEGKSAVDHASYREELRELFPEAGEAPAYETIARELPPLLRAIHLDDREAFTAALSAGGPEQSNYRGDTALMLAAGLRRRHMFQALIDAGAALEAQNARGESPWTYAFTAGAEDLRTALEERGAKNSMETMNQMAAQMMRRDAARKAIEAGDVGSLARMIDALDIDVDLLGPGVRPLDLAIARRDAALVQLLLAKGADPSLDGASGRSLAELGHAAGFAELFS